MVLALVFIVIMIGIWSEESAVMVCQVVNLAKLEEIVVMSGDVGCWFLFPGILVGVFWFRIIWSEFWMRS